MNPAILVNECRLVNPFHLTSKTTPHLNTFCHSLALQNRYSGHTVRPYSVAEHTVNLVTWLESVERYSLVPAALIHDFSEIFVCDLPNPIKAHMPSYVSLETQIQKKIFQHFNVPWEQMAKIKEFDRRISEDEMNNLFDVYWTIGLEPLGINIDPEQTPDWQLVKNTLRQFCLDYL